MKSQWNEIEMKGLWRKHLEQIFDPYREENIQNENCGKQSDDVISIL